MAVSDVTKRVIYRTEDGGVAVVIPTPEFLETHTIEDVAATLPPGTKYKILDLTDEETEAFLADRTFRNAWEVDEEDLTDGVGQGAYFGDDANA